MARTMFAVSKKKRGGGPKPFAKKRILDNLPLIAEWARNGYTLKEIADGLRIHIATLCDYKNRLPELDEAIKVNRAIADRRVENSLYQRAIGYTATEEISSKKRGPDGTTVETKTVQKHIAPDVTAQIFWLKNRRPKDWRDKQEVKHDGTINIHIDEQDAKVV